MPGMETRRYVRNGRGGRFLPPHARRSSDEAFQDDRVDPPPFFTGEGDRQNDGGGGDIRRRRVRLPPPPRFVHVRSGARIVDPSGV